MYERNAIVLERYFYRIFNFKNSSNLKENYYNYRKLFDCYGILCSAKEKEKLCQREFDSASKEISKLQKTQEKLYNRSAKFEYSRYIIFSNITEKTETIEKHLNQVDNDVQKNVDELRELGEKFVQAVDDYNEKEKNLNDAILDKEKAQKDYDEAYLNAQTCFNQIKEDLITDAKNFIKSDNKENRKELQEIFEDNGKNEKNHFDPDVILNTINKSIEIYKIEMEIYLAGYDRISKLFEEIENDSVKYDKHTKFYRDSKAKLDFLNAEKDYIVQFLDNERIGAIYDKKTHRKLMLEACKKFALDFAQIEKLYDIIIKETVGRSTKKIYKENYNKEYLVALEEASVEPSLDTGKMRQEAIAFVNLNYWRIEGMKTVYSTFENVVTVSYEKDLSEFIPESLKKQIVEEENKTEQPVEDLVEEAQTEKKAKPRKIYYSSKISLANAIYYSLQSTEFAESEFECIEDKQLTDEKDIYENEDLLEAPVGIEDEDVASESFQENIIENVEENESVESTENDEGMHNQEIAFAIAESQEENPVSIEDEIEEESIIPIEDETEEESIIPIVEEVEEDDIISTEESAEEENVFDLSKLDEIDDDIESEDNIEIDELETEEEQEIDEEDEEEDSILEIYFCDNDDTEKEEAKSTTNNLNKKVGLFQKLVGFNSKKKKEA